MAHAFNPSTGRGRRIFVSEVSLVYRESSKAVRATLRNPFSKTKKQAKTNFKSKPQNCGSNQRRVTLVPKDL